MNKTKKKVSRKDISSEEELTSKVMSYIESDMKDYQSITASKLRQEITIRKKKGKEGHPHLDTLKKNLGIGKTWKPLLSQGGIDFVTDDEGNVNGIIKLPLMTQENIKEKLDSMENKIDQLIKTKREF